ncbi:beta carbonic anhydrase 1-like [Amphiura filiformis]|uniref:beta carbonic anhydrase 1-like n=1 Tax=Amphiura filiformis TaxID=82378 RepID=UPI003B20FACD
MPPIEKLFRGILKFQSTVKGEYMQSINNIKGKLSPPVLFVSCMDSRVLPTRFCQSDPGDMVLIRSAANVISRSEGHLIGQPNTDAVGLELAIKLQGVRHIVVCGHADCKAITVIQDLQANVAGGEFSRDTEPFSSWWRGVATTSLAKLQTMHNNPGQPVRFAALGQPNVMEAFIDPENKLNPVDKLSQLNTLQQLENLWTHDIVREKLLAKKLILHAMWFDVRAGNVFLFSQKRKRFIEVCDKELPNLEELVLAKYYDW